MSGSFPELMRCFYLAHREALVNYAVALVGSRTDAEDVVQTVIARILERRRAPRDLRPFVFRSVRNEAFDRHRRNGRDPGCASPGSGEPDLWSGPDEDAAIRQCVNRLESDDRELVILKVVAGLTFKEIATLQNQNLNSVASRYRRALNRLREELGG